MRIKRTPKTISIQATSDGMATGQLFITVWPEKPQVEIYTTRGKGFVVEDDNAREFAATLKKELIDPIMKGTV